MGGVLFAGAFHPHKIGEGIGKNVLGVLGMAAGGAVIQRLDGFPVIYGDEPMGLRHRLAELIRILLGMAAPAFRQGLGAAVALAAMAVGTDIRAAPAARGPRPGWLCAAPYRYGCNGLGF